jgi:hypothetical protein
MCITPRFSKQLTFLRVLFVFHVVRTIIVFGENFCLLFQNNSTVCFKRVLYIVLCLCLYVVLFMLLATWLLTQHVNKQELN